MKYISLFALVALLSGCVVQPAYDVYPVVVPRVVIQPAPVYRPAPIYMERPYFDRHGVPNPYSPHYRPWGTPR